MIAQDPDLLALPWRTCGHPGLAVLAQVGDGRYMLVGMMATPEIAALVCEAHNEGLGIHPEAERLLPACLHPATLGYGLNTVGP